MAWVVPGWGGSLRPRPQGRLSRALLSEAAALAEELVEDFFRLGSRWRALQYEVLTDTPWELPEETLAALVRAEVDHPLPHRRRDFYFILLQEGRLTSLAQGDFLRALLLYIFTHELVHMVRFVRFAACFWMRPEDRVREERLVHNLCREVLGRVKMPRLEEVLSLFNRLYQ